MKDTDDVRINTEIDEITERINNIMKKVGDLVPDTKEEQDQKED
jgi:hypothetical protein